MRANTIIIFIFISTSCSNTDQNNKEPIDNKSLKVIHFDGCQYLQNKHGAIVHKGNCSNKAAHD